MSVKSANFTYVYFKDTFHANPGDEIHKQDKGSMVQHTYFKSFQIHQLIMMYHLQQTNLNVHLDF